MKTTSTSNKIIIDETNENIKSIINQSTIDLEQQPQQQLNDQQSLNKYRKNRLKSYNNIHNHCFHCICPLKCIKLPVSFNDVHQLSMEEKYSMILDVDYYCDESSNNNNNNNNKNLYKNTKKLLNGFNDDINNYDINDDDDEYCPVVRCTNNNCNMIMHYCKMNEHFLLCKYQIIPCINSYFGCPYKLLRGQMSKHLSNQCPANVVHCSAEWNRMPLYSSDKNIITQNFSSPHSLNINNLDVALALRDQRMLKQLWSASRQMKRIMRGRLSTHPAVPIKPYIGIRTFREFKRTTTTTNKNLSITNNNNNNNNNGNDNQSSTTINNNNNNNNQLISTSSLSYYCDSNNIEEEKYLNYAARLVANAYKESLIEILKQTAQYYRRIYLESSHDYRQQQEQLRKKSNSICSQMLLEQQINNQLNNNNLNDKKQLLLSPTLSIQQSYPSSSSINLPIITDADKQFMIEMLRKNNENSNNDNSNENLINNNDHQKIRQQKQQKDKQLYLKQQQQQLLPPPIQPPPVPKCNTLSLEISIRSYAFHQPKPRSMYTFRCGLDFRKDELHEHSLNIHNDIHGGLDGWIEYRCPLFYMGCTFVHRRLWPYLSKNDYYHQNNNNNQINKNNLIDNNKQKTTIVYNESLETFACCSINDDDEDDFDNNNNNNNSNNSIDNEIICNNNNNNNDNIDKNISFDDYDYDYDYDDDDDDDDDDSISINIINNNHKKLKKQQKKLNKKINNNNINNNNNSSTSTSTSTSSSSYSLLYSLNNNNHNININNNINNNNSSTIPLLLYDDDDDNDNDSNDSDDLNKFLKFNNNNNNNNNKLKNGQKMNNLSLNDFPFELLQNICKYLDGFSLNNLSFTSKRMRMVVQSFVKKKGYVVLQWKRFEIEKGKFQWRVVYKKWLFSTAMQPIYGWRLDSDNVMAKHLQICPFYERNIRTEPFRICEFDPKLLNNNSNNDNGNDNDDGDNNFKNLSTIIRAQNNKNNSKSNWNRKVAMMK